MTCMYGEILFPDSRAFYDDYDEAVENNLPTYELKWTENSSRPEKFRNLVLFEGAAKIEDFVKESLVKNIKPVCTVGSMKIYKLENDYIIHVFAHDFQKFGSVLTELLTPWLSNAKNVIIFSFQSHVAYKGSDVDAETDYTFIRSLNSRFEATATDKILQEPNIICGIGAGIATWRICSNLTTEIYVAYLNSNIYDMNTVGPILKLMKNLKLPVAEKYTYTYVDDSVLYM